MNPANVIRYFRYEFIKMRAFKTITGRNFIKKHPEYAKESKYLKEKGRLLTFPYPFTDNYNAEKFELFRDKESGVPYFNYNGRKLFFSDANINESDGMVRWKFACLASEQDINSPHRYFTEDFKVEQGDTFIDVGCAEGKEALDVIDDAGEVYLFEADENWLQSLKLTFAEYMSQDLENNVALLKKFGGGTEQHKVHIIKNMSQIKVVRTA